MKHISKAKVEHNASFLPRHAVLQKKLPSHIYPFSIKCVADLAGSLAQYDSQSRCEGSFTPLMMLAAPSRKLRENVDPYLVIVGDPETFRESRWCALACQARKGSHSFP